MKLQTYIEDAYEKIVANGHGDWCYEQNGLFGWALSKFGFDVTRIAASVMREQREEASTASHLCLLVRSPESKTKYLVDVGFGGSMESITVDSPEALISMLANEFRLDVPDAVTLWPRIVARHEELFGSNASC